VLVLFSVFRWVRASTSAGCSPRARGGVEDLLAGLTILELNIIRQGCRRTRVCGRKMNFW
jgi:hypothetical protein